MKRKNHFVLFGILLLALINLSPSVPDASPSGPRREPEAGFAVFREGESAHPLRDIEVYTMMGSEEFEAFQEVNEKYQERSGTVVTLVNIAPGQAYKTYREAYASGREPDVLMLDGAWVADFAASGRLLPADFYEADVATISDMLPAPSVEWNGYRWAVPLDLDPYAAAWNPERFKATDGELPQLGEAWREWEAGESEGSGKTGFAVGLPSGDTRAFAALIALWKGERAGEAGGKERLSAALDLANELRPNTYREKTSSPGGQKGSDLRTKVEAGELGLAVDRLSKLGVRESSSLRLDALPFAAPTAVLRCFGIAANTDRTREASLWISYITDRETQGAWHRLTGRLPALRVVYDDPASAGLLRWLPEPQVARPADEIADSKKAGAREISWSRSLDSFYEGRLGIDGISGYLLP